MNSSNFRTMIILMALGGAVAGADQLETQGFAEALWGGCGLAGRRIMISPGRAS